ncbi:Asx homology domain-containing protein [Aspergillus terricola var. indicus]
MASTNSKPKRTPRRAAKDKYEEEMLMTSDKSQLIDLDLVKLLALPEAWDCLEESEKQEILDLLPSDTHPNPDPPPDDPNAKIPPLPESFLRYSTNWREAIRHFQLDLQNGRYDPQWVREAEEAVAQRAAGKFDKFKEQEFEEFWGQKQKMDRALAAGESSKIKLSTLIKHGVIRRGDIWKWSRSVRKILVEKEARIIDISESRLTFAVPAGQRTFLKTSVIPNAKTTGTEERPEDQPEPGSISPHLTQTNGGASADTNDTEAGPSRKRSAEPDTGIIATKRPRGLSPNGRPAPIQEEASATTVEISNGFSEDGMNSSSYDIEHNVDPSAESRERGSEYGAAPGNTKPEVSDDSKREEPEVFNTLPDGKPSQSLHEEDEEPGEVIVRDIQGPTALTSEMLKIDGRVGKATNGNAWKELRCFRDNQDMGTLWEVRHAWYVKNNKGHPFQ